MKNFGRKAVACFLFLLGLVFLAGCGDERPTTVVSRRNEPPHNYDCRAWFGGKSIFEHDGSPIPKDKLEKKYKFDMALEFPTKAPVLAYQDRFKEDLVLWKRAAKYDLKTSQNSIIYKVIIFSDYRPNCEKLIHPLDWLEDKPPKLSEADRKACEARSKFFREY